MIYARLDQQGRDGGQPTIANSLTVGRRVAALTGDIYNRRELGATDDDDRRLILDLYDRYGSEFAARLNGRFSFVIWDEPRRKLVAGRDQLGVEPLFYYEEPGRLVIASSIREILEREDIPRQLNESALRSYLLFMYNPGCQTLFDRVRRVRPAHLIIDAGDGPQTRRYWNVSFAETRTANEKETAEAVREQLDRAVRRRLYPGQATGVFLSGGMDSSSVLGLAARSHDAPLISFSYRCRGESFDESHYARIMAESVGAEHIIAEYSPEGVLAMQDVVAQMDEPFCDLGINLATWILGQAAQGRVDHVLTGDGGDELFGGHPIYEADKIASWADRVPAFVKRPLIGFGGLLPDSDKKKTAWIKIKRFAESLTLPPQLLSHRWRTYYGAAEMRELLEPGLAEDLSDDKLFGEIFDFNGEGDGADLLSRSLYSDYQTVVDFYLRRNGLIRSMGVQARFPMLDPELVTFCAGIPSEMKIRGWFDTKYIMKKAMEPVLPHGIVYRKDKLGHSIPLKNWMRDNERVREFTLDYLSEETISRRGFFRPSCVQTMIDEHLARRRNNSHRLWTLAVLEMWLQRHVDRQAVLA